MSLATTLKSLIQENVVAVALGAVPTFVTGLIAWAWPGTLQQIADVVLSTATPKQLMVALCISFLVNAVLVALLINLRTSGPKLYPRFGIYWDKEGNSYCPKCKTLTSQISWATFNNSQWHGLRCTCTERAFVCFDAGQPIHAQEAMRMVKNA